jgi:hypothetical protein
VVDYRLSAKLPDYILFDAESKEKGGSHGAKVYCALALAFRRKQYPKTRRNMIPIFRKSATASVRRQLFTNRSIEMEEWQVCGV